MKIMVVSYHYGISATGICVERIVDGLVGRGCEVELFCANCRNGISTEGVYLHRSSQWPNRPGYFFEYLSNIAQIDLQHVAWRTRAQNAIVQRCQQVGADCIYAIASPVASLIAGLNASQRTGLPLVAHFMDPIPAPLEWMPDKPYRSRMIKTTRPILKHAAAVVFLTEETARYQQEVTGTRIPHKARVIPNIVPPWKDLAMPTISPSTDMFLYLGSFYRNRTPGTLLEGFRRLLVQHPAARLRFVGADPKMINPYLTEGAVAEAVEILPRTKAIDSAMARAAVLIDVDAPDREPVFLSSKLSDYLCVNRVILSISPPDSPASKLLARDLNTVVTASHDPNEIATAMEKALQLSRAVGDQDFARRRAAYRFLSGPTVASELENCLRTVSNAQRPSVGLQAPHRNV